MNEVEVTRMEPPISETAFLVIHRGSARIDVVELSCSLRYMIGRADTCRIVIPDPKCSRHHCEIFCRAGLWFVRDLESRNGVTINGKRVENEQRLLFGEAIGIGQYSLTLASQHPEDAESSVFNYETADFEIVERQSGTQFDRQPGMQRMQRRKEGATELFRVARDIAIANSTSDLTKAVLDGIYEHTNAGIGAICLLEGTEANVDSLRVVAFKGEGTPDKLSTFLSRIVLTDREAILAHDISKHTSLRKQESLHKLLAESAICAPIRHGKNILGLIHLYSVEASSPLTQEDLEFTLAIADQMGDQLHSILERERLAAGIDRIKRVNDELRGQLATETELIGHGEKLEQLRRAIGRVAPSDALVLIRGESGVGKELVARAIHFNSLRKDAPIVCVNCAALNESLLESELFGHEKGAFTGAANRRVGKFEQADGGTLFLDEIGEMSPEIQAKFLRVLEGQAFERVGGSEPITVDVRVVTATNRDLEAAVREGKFRRDLFFRLQVIEVQVPPLREHPEDIPAIAQHFVSRFATQSHRQIRGFNSAAIKKLQEPSWPGNVRELRNVVERAVILGDSELLGADDVFITKLQLDPESAEQAHSPAATAEDVEAGKETNVDPLIDLFGSYIQAKTSLDNIDKLYIQAVLESTKWNKSKASRILQIERTTLDRRLKKYELSRPDGNDDSDDDDMGDDED